jgi:hypothetical protein
MRISVEGIMDSGWPLTPGLYHVLYGAALTRVEKAEFGARLSGPRCLELTHDNQHSRSLSAFGAVERVSHGPALPTY